MRYEVIIDTGETANKCTIAPLRYRPDFSIYSVKGKLQLGPLTSPILLHPDGVCLTSLKDTSISITGIACIDCVWRRLDPLLHRIVKPLPQFAKIPSGFLTAYPRTSSYNTDPEGGLATIEAIFIAAAILGNWDVSLLSEYYFAPKFVEMNRNKFLELGIKQAADPDAQPIHAPRPKHSKQRKLDRKLRF